MEETTTMGRRKKRVGEKSRTAGPRIMVPGLPWASTKDTLQGERHHIRRFYDAGRRGRPQSREDRDGGEHVGEEEKKKRGCTRRGRPIRDKKFGSTFSACWDMLYIPRIIVHMRPNKK